MKTVSIKLVSIDKEIIANNELSVEAIKSLAEVDDILDLTYDMYANVKLNHNLIGVAKQFMKNHNLDKAVLWVTNDFTETTENFELSV